MRLKCGRKTAECNFGGGPGPETKESPEFEMKKEVKFREAARAVSPSRSAVPPDQVLRPGGIA